MTAMKNTPQKYRWLAKNWSTVFNVSFAALGAVISAVAGIVVFLFHERDFYRGSITTLQSDYRHLDSELKNLRDTYGKLGADRYQDRRTENPVIWMVSMDPKKFEQKKYISPSSLRVRTKPNVP